MKVPINEIVDLEVFIVVAPGIEKCFSHLDPAEVTDELDDGKDWNVHLWGVNKERIPGVRDGHVDAESDQSGPKLIE